MALKRAVARRVVARFLATAVLVALLASPGPASSGWVGGIENHVLGLFAPSCASAGPPSYPSTVLGDTPLAYYRLDESSGSLTNDSSGNNQNLTYGAHAVLGQTGLIAGDSDTAAVAAGGAIGVVSTARGAGALSSAVASRRGRLGGSSRRTPGWRTDGRERKVWGRRRSRAGRRAGGCR
jgi:hypothetical protein